MQPTLEGYKEAINYTVDKERERRKGEREKKENKWLYIWKNNTMK